MKISEDFSRVCPVFRIFDEARARDFYLDFLEFAIVFEHRFAPGMPLYMGIRRGNFELHLSEHNGDGSPGSVVYLETAGLREYQQMLVAKNHKYFRPGIHETDWGTVEMTIIDPFHNLLRFNEKLEVRDADKE